MKPQKTLEIGLSYGGSCLAFTSSHQHNATIGHIACDPYQKQWDNAGLHAIERAGLTPYLEFKEEASALALPDLLRKGDQFGLVYIDGSHFFDDVFVDFYYAVRMLTKDGIVLLDDSSTDHVRKVLRFIRSNWSSWVEEVDLAPYRDDLSWKYRVAKKLERIQLTAFRRVGNDLRAWDAPLRRF